MNKDKILIASVGCLVFVLSFIYLFYMLNGSLAVSISSAQELGYYMAQFGMAAVFSGLFAAGAMIAVKKSRAK